MERLEELKLDLETIDNDIDTALVRIEKAKEEINYWNASYNSWKEELERNYYQRDIIEEQIYNLNN